VEPKDVNGVLANALAEIHFSLKHYRIQHKDEKGFNSFTATIKQIIVLKSGVPKSRSAYKHDNPRSGPLMVKNIRVSMNNTNPSMFARSSASTSKLVAITDCHGMQYRSLNIVLPFKITL
jgi:hypothetical protein